jgi:hypothetical protein
MYFRYYLNPCLELPINSLEQMEDYNYSLLSYQGFQAALYQLSFLTKESQFQQMITDLLESTPSVLSQRGLRGIVHPEAHQKLYPPVIINKDDMTHLTPEDPEAQQVPMVHDHMEDPEARHAPMVPDHMVLDLRDRD